MVCKHQSEWLHWMVGPIMKVRNLWIIVIRDILEIQLSLRVI